MARRVDESDQSREDSGKSLLAITKGKLLILLKKCKGLQADMDESRSEMGGLTSAAVERDNLHKGAFGLIKRLDRMDPVKRNEFLFHWDCYRDYMGWEQSDLLADRQPEERRVPRRVAAEEGEGASA